MSVIIFLKGQKWKITMGKNVQLAARVNQFVLTANSKVLKKYLKLWNKDSKFDSFINLFSLLINSLAIVFIILILSFIIPNEFMEISVNYICNMKNTKENECSVILKFIACILFISILLIAEILTSRYLKNKRWKYSARYSKS